MGQEISQQQQQNHNQNHNHNQNLNLNLNHNHNHNLNPKRGQAQRRSYNKDHIYTPASQLSSSCSSQSTQNDCEANYRLRHKYNLSKQTYERTKINVNPHRSSLDSDSHYAKLQRSSSQSSDSGIYNSSCHCSSLSSLSAVSSSSASSSSGCPSSLLSSKSSRSSLDKQKHYLSHHLYIKSYLDILEEDERARAHFKSARPGGIRNYTPKILGGGTDSASSTLSTSAPSSSFGYPANSNSGSNSKQRSSVVCNTSTSGASGRCGTSTEDPWI